MLRLISNILFLSDGSDDGSAHISSSNETTATITLSSEQITSDMLPVRSF